MFMHMLLRKQLNRYKINHIDALPIFKGAWHALRNSSYLFVQPW